MNDMLGKDQRVRVKPRSRVAGYAPGDRGTVLRASWSAATGRRYYVVAMDRDDSSGAGVLFAEDEVELEGVGGAGEAAAPAAAATSDSATVVETYP